MLDEFNIYTNKQASKQLQLGFPWLRIIKREIFGPLNYTARFTKQFKACLPIELRRLKSDSRNSLRQNLRIVEEASTP